MTICVRVGLRASCIAVVLALAVVGGAQALTPEYEVWLTDQNNTAGYTSESPRGTHGGRVLIYGGDALDRRDGPDNRPETIDLAQLFAAGGSNNSTGAEVVRPHMLLPSPDHRFVALSFVASGHVAIFDAATRRPVALFRMSPGAGGARQAHAAYWTPDGQALIVANQNGKLLERIDYDAQTGTFIHRTEATLDLVSCTTPSGHPCQTATPLSDSDPAYAGVNNRPDNAPICPIVSSDGKAYVTFRGGGMFVVDVTRTPMQIVGEFGTSAVGRDGCGGKQLGSRMFLNSGAGTPATNISEFTLFQLRDAFPDAPEFRAPNTPATKVFYRDATPDTLSDAHAMALAGNNRYLWQFDRLANEAHVFDTATNPPRHVRRVDLLASGVSDDPTPDIADLSPRGNRFYVALRGPLPQTGAHAAQGSTPGLGIVTLTDGGRSGALRHVLRTTFTNPVTGQEESDPHGIAVRLTQPTRPLDLAAASAQIPTICDLSNTVTS